MDAGPGAAAAPGPARFTGDGAKAGTAPMRAMGLICRRKLDPTILVFGDANRGRTELGGVGCKIFLRRLDTKSGGA